MASELMGIGGKPSTRTWLDYRRFGAWVLGETFLPVLMSAPVAGALQWGRRRGVWLTLPEDKSANSWRWLCWRLRHDGPIYAVRWTLPKKANGLRYYGRRFSE